MDKLEEIKRLLKEKEAIQDENVELQKGIISNNEKINIIDQKIITISNEYNASLGKTNSDEVGDVAQFMAKK